MRLAAVLDAPRTAAAEPSPAEGFASIPGMPLVTYGQYAAGLRISALRCHLVQLSQAFSTQSAMQRSLLGS